MTDYPKFIQVNYFKKPSKPIKKDVTALLEQ